MRFSLVNFSFFLSFFLFSHFYSLNIQYFSIMLFNFVLSLCCIARKPFYLISGIYNFARKEFATLISFREKLKIIIQNVIFIHFEKMQSKLSILLKSFNYTFSWLFKCFVSKKRLTFSRIFDNCDLSMQLPFQWLFSYLF